VAEPAYDPSVELVDDEPPIDQDAVEHAYRHARARRIARIQRRRANRQARRRFWLVVGALVLASLVLVVTIWIEVERLFGL
jgi:hypothetical protein